MNTGLLKKRLGIVAALAAVIFLAFMACTSYANAAEKVVVIQPGHSIGNDSGALGVGDKPEAELNEIVAGKLVRLLQERGYKAYITHHSGNEFDDCKIISNYHASWLKNVGKAVNSKNPDIAISLHHNSADNVEASGTEIYWSSYRDFDPEDIYQVPGIWWTGRDAYRDRTPTTVAKQSLRFAKIIKSQLEEKSKLPFRYIVERDDYLPAHATCPCILYEGGYLSNQSDCAYMMTEEYQDNAAEILASCIDEYFADPEAGNNVSRDVESLTVTAPRTVMSAGSKMGVDLESEPERVHSSVLTWYSSNPQVATVESGVVRAISPGPVTIAAATKDGSVSGSVNITVEAPDTPHVSYSLRASEGGKWSGSVMDGQNATGSELDPAIGLRVDITSPDMVKLSPDRLVTVPTVYRQYEGWTGNNEEGTNPENSGIEAFHIELDGADKDNYDICYRSYVPNLGWLAWAKNGEPSGAAGDANKISDIQVKLVPAGTVLEPESQHPAFLDFTNAARSNNIVTEVSAPNAEETSAETDA